VWAVVAEGLEEAIRKFSSLLSRGADLKFLFLSLVDVLRDTAVWKFTEKDDLLFRHSPSSLARMKELCALRSREEWMFLLDIAFRSEKDVLGTEFPRLGFELLLLRLVNAPGLLAVEGLAEEEPAAAPGRPPAVTAKVQATAAKRVPAGDPPRRHGGDLSSEARRAKEEVTEAKEEPRTPKEEVWEGIRRTLEEKRKPLLVALLHQMRGKFEGSELVITCPHQMQLDRLREEDKWPVLVQAAEEFVGKKISIRLVAGPEKKGPASDRPGGGEGGPEKRALADPLLAEVLREFEGATVLEIRPGPRRTPTPRPEDAEDQEPDKGGEEAEEAE